MELSDTSIQIAISYPPVLSDKNPSKGLHENA